MGSLAGYFGGKVDAVIMWFINVSWSIPTLLLVIAITLALGAASLTSNAQTVMVGGEAMYPQKNIVENAVKSGDHTTLVAAVKAAGLVDALQGDGPLTVFAPVNGAFDALPEGTVSTLLKPENKDMLTGILTYHVVAGKLDAEAIMKKIKNGHLKEKCLRL